MSLFNLHRKTLEKAISSVKEGVFFNHYPELHTDKIFNEQEISAGYEKFREHLNKKFESLRQAKPLSWEGDEESPFLMKPLNIKYPTFSVETLIKRAKDEFDRWRKIKLEERAGLLLESLKRVENKFHEIAFAQMHTTGMSYHVSFQMAGPHAAQRALNAIAMGYDSLLRFPETDLESISRDEFGIRLNKKWKAVPKGISLIISTPNFPLRDAVPGIYASLITGNPVIINPHASSILPIAIVISEIQKVFSENGYDPDICQIAIETKTEEFAKALADQPEVKLIDFKGNENMLVHLQSLHDKTIFSEKNSINSVILDSVDDLEFTIHNLVLSLALYSGQMNNTPQNFFIPENGIETREGKISYKQFILSFLEELDHLVNHAHSGPLVMGAIQDPQTPDNLAQLESKAQKVYYRASPYKHPDYPNARTLCPMVIELGPDQKEVFFKHYFGPVGLIIKTKDVNQSIMLANETARECGSLYCSAFTTHKNIKDKILDSLTVTNTPVTFNMVGNIYLEKGSAYDHFHLTGGNTASIASSSNLEFVLRRFTWVGYREPVYDE
jgi:phenylacetic acid degradation protein paaN